MADRCDNCRARLRGQGKRTATRTLCEKCYLAFSGRAAGYLSGGSVGNAISVSGWATSFANKKTSRRRTGDKG